MKELKAFDAIATPLVEQAKSGDVVRGVALSGMGWAVLGGVAATPLGLAGVALSAGALVWQAIEESHRSGHSPRWLPTGLWKGYGLPLAAELMGKDNPRMSAIALLFHEIGRDEVEGYLSALPEHQQAIALGNLIEARLELGRQVDNIELDSDAEKVLLNGLEELRSMMVLDEEQSPVEPVDKGFYTSTSTAESGLNLFDWAEIQRRPNAFPHLLILGKTGAGKSTLAESLLPLLGGDRLVITPHHRPSDFPGCKVIGKGRDYVAIAVALQGLEREMQQRYERYSVGDEDYPFLNVVIDEFPAIAANCGKAATESVKLLTREARKVGIRLILLSQGAEVKALGIEGEGSIRECFTLVRLKGFAEDYARRLRDARISEWIARQQYPCLVEDVPADSSVLASLKTPVETVDSTFYTAAWVEDESRSDVTDEGEEGDEDDYDPSWYVPQLGGVALSDEGKRLYGWLIRKREQGRHQLTVRQIQQGKPLDGKTTPNSEVIQQVISELLMHQLAQVDVSKSPPLIRLL